MPDPQFFHAIDPADSMFAHNLFVGKGKITALSAVRHFHPEWSSIMSPYEMFTREREKEEVFERVRADKFSDQPPRLGSIFLFPTRQIADDCNTEWWRGTRVILEARVIAKMSGGVFDSRQLNAAKDDWEAAASRYWSSQFTSDPRVEVVLCGAVELLNWEPYARLLAP